MKYGKEITDELCKFFRQGSNREDAATMVGISKETFYQWLNHKPDFADAIKKAEAECKQRNISIIQKAAITTWQAAAWWLERKHNTEFGIRNQVDFTGGANKIVVTFKEKPKK